MRNQHPRTELREAQAALAISETELREAQAALAMAEATIQEQRDRMTDLLLLIGSRTTCSRCGTGALWVIVRGGAALLYDADGNPHWLKCTGAERPREAAAGE